MKIKSKRYLVQSHYSNEYKRENSFNSVNDLYGFTQKVNWS